MNANKETIMPIQPIKDGRFVPNRIVRELLDTHPTMNMNTLAFGDYTQQERTQFAQLIGYSLGGFSELDYVDDETFGAAEKSQLMNESLARNQELRDQLEASRKGVRIAAEALFKIHPDDLET